jgi:hypothetical protein
MNNIFCDKIPLRIQWNSVCPRCPFSPHRSPYNFKKGFLSPWMSLAIYFFNLVLVNFAVDLRCRNIRMSEHFLYCLQIRAVFYQMYGEGMP